MKLHIWLPLLLASNLVAGKKRWARCTCIGPDGKSDVVVTHGCCDTTTVDVESGQYPGIYCIAAASGGIDGRQWNDRCANSLLGAHGYCYVRD
ncbi:hypothetical protein N7499_004182 [Penicillium canescens]|nr:hypothetical protein N7444_001650 [Penicillium canescens]KAJ6088931.1 hypothetical protein N7499_004182 [Penicillium canescens]